MKQDQELQGIILNLLTKLSFKQVPYLGCYNR